jgi:hypothetical protein
MPEKEPMAEVRLELELGGMWGAQIQFFHAVQDWVKSVNVAPSLRGWVRLTSTPQI